MKKTHACLYLALLLMPGLSYASTFDEGQSFGAAEELLMARLLTRLPEMRSLFGYSGCRALRVEGECSKARQTTCEVTCPAGSASMCVQAELASPMRGCEERTPAKCWCERSPQHPAAAPN
jgi:hypothetical protein